MNKIQNNKLSMYQVVIEICNEYKRVWEVLPILNTAFSDFVTVVSQIRATFKEQGEVLKGLTEDKGLSRTDMEEKAFRLSKTLFAFANFQENKQLAQAVNFTRSQFTSGTDNQVKEWATMLIEKATQYKNLLVDFNVTATTLTDLETAINNYLSYISAPRKAISQRTERTASLKNLFNQADALLKLKIDPLMLQFSDTTFYPVYKSSRVIVDRGRRVKKEITK